MRSSSRRILQPHHTGWCISAAVPGSCGNGTTPVGGNRGRSEPSGQADFFSELDDSVVDEEVVSEDDELDELDESDPADLVVDDEEDA